MSDSEPANDTAADSSAWDDTRITAYVMGELSPEDSVAFENAVATDPELRAAVDQAGTLTDELHKLFATETLKKLDSDRREKILAANAESTRAVELSRTDRSPSRNRLVPWLLAAAAALLLTFGLVPAFNRSRVTQSPRQSNRIETSLELSTALETASDDLSGKAIVDEKLRRQLGRDEIDQSLPVVMLSDQGVISDQGVTASEVPEPEKESLAYEGVSERGRSLSLKSGMLKGRIGNLRAAVPSPTSGPEAAAELAKPKRDVALGVKDLALQTTADGTILSGGRGGQPQVATSPVPVRMKEEENAPTPFGVAGVPTDKELQTSAELSDGLRQAGQNRLEKEVKATIRHQSVAERNVAMTTPAASVPATNTMAEKGIQGVPLPVQTRGKSSTRSVQDFRRVLGKQGAAGEDSKASIRLPQSWQLSERIITSSERFDPITENEFKSVTDHPLSTFSIDVDTASYSKVRRTLAEGRLPRADAVRIEELVNYFDYNYQPPADDAEHPFAADVTIAGCPWNTNHRLARVAIQGKTIKREQRPPCNLVFLLDTSGSMNRPNKLPLVIEGMKMLTKQLNDEDRVAIVVYAGSAGMALGSTPAEKRKKIKKALTQLSAGGSTNGGAGIQLAYATARDHFIKKGVNRVILCTDGDFNVGLSGTDELVRLIKDEASHGIFLTALGFGMDNHNDAMMEQISGKGNGNYAFIDTANEACKVLVRQTNATLVTIAKDVKLQLEFNPRMVSKYRLIGYENRVMAKEDFKNDKKDAGEIGAGHQVTALYELVPAGDGGAIDVGDDSRNDGGESASVDPLKYQESPKLTPAASGGDAMTIKLRYKQPDGDTSTPVEFAAKDDERGFAEVDADFRFAASVASFGMLLRESRFAGDWTMNNVHEVAEANQGEDEFQLRAEFVELVSAARRLRGGK